MRTTTCNHEVVQSSKTVVVAVKPHVVPSVLEEIAQDVDEKKLIVSIAAGVTLAQLQSVSFWVRRRRL